MKILVLLPDSPDPWSNTAARYYGPMLRTLSAMGEDVTVLAVRRYRDDAKELAYFKDTKLRIRLFDPPQARPLIERKLRSLWRSGWELAASEFGRVAREEAHHDYDVILAEHPFAARAVEDDPRTVLSLHCLHHIDLAPSVGTGADLSVRERIQAKRAELSTCRRVPVVRVLTERLRSLLCQAGIDKAIPVIPLCIDPALYEPQPAPAVPTVGVLGSMFWAPSRQAAMHFLDLIAPRIRAARPGVRFLLGGWQARQYLQPFVHHDDVDILDSFPNPAEAFARLSVLVYAPPVGTGMKVKVLEAMAYGVPAVVNSQGFEGLDVDSDCPVQLGNSDAEIVDHVLRLLDDRTARARFAEEGRRCIERSFSPAAVTHALVQLFQQRAGPRLRA